MSDQNNKIFSLLELAVSSSESDSDSDSDIFEIITKYENEDERLMEELCKGFDKKKRNCIKNYLSETVPSYTEKEFRRHFRICRTLFENLSTRFEDSNFYKELREDKRFPGSTHMAVFLWFAGHEACSFRDLADRFDVSLSSVCRIINRALMFISSLGPHVIKWPNEDRKKEIANVFEQKCGFSKTIGCIDGCHIEIDPPKKAKDDYIDRKGHTTITLQGICDEQKHFINIFVGFPGSSHDSWIFQNSPIFGKLSSYCGNFYLLGDSAYPCTRYVVTPYRDNGHLTRSQKNFNVLLSSGRVRIEHTFGILKQRFRQLYFCKLRGVEKLCHFIRACCVLHNLANIDDLDFVLETMPDESDDIEANENTITANAIREAIYQDILHKQNIRINEL